MNMRLIVIASALAVLLPTVLHAQEKRSGKGLTEIPDPELNLMRGRYTVGGNNVAWFGVTMASQWQASSGAAMEGALKLGMDFRQGGTPKVSFTPTVSVTAADAPLPQTAADTASAAIASVDSSGLANVSGLVQSVQVAGDENSARNVTSLTIRDGEVPVVADSGVRSATAQQGGASATASFDNNQARLELQLEGVGAVQQWIRSGSVGQTIALGGNAQQVSNRLQIELVRQSMASNTPLTQNIAQAMALTRGIGPGQ